MQRTVTVEIELEAERPSQRGRTLVAVGVLGPRVAKIRVSSEYHARQVAATVDADGVAI